MEQPENVSDWSRITTSYFDWVTETPERYLTDMTGVPYILDTKLYTLLTHGYLWQTMHCHYFLIDDNFNNAAVFFVR